MAAGLPHGAQQSGLLTGPRGQGRAFLSGTEVSGPDTARSSELLSGQKLLPSPPSAGTRASGFKLAPKVTLPVLFFAVIDRSTS